MITLKDIAKEADLSVTQVSRALNGHEDVSEETRKRVQTLANTMGYVKNLAAHRLVTGTSNQIAFVVQGFKNKNNESEYNEFYDILNGIHQFSSEKQYETVLYIIQSIQHSYIQFFKEKGIQNAILYGFDYDDPKLIELLNTNYNIVCIDIPVEGINKGCVVINNTYYSTLAVEALLNSGKQNIAIITGSHHASVSLEREAGYRIALQKKRIPIIEEYIVDANFNQQIAYQKTLKLLEQYPQIDGFFCISDYMALGCMEAIKNIGKIIPKDIAIIGFDDIPITRYVAPKLSTISQNSYSKGFEAAKLIDAIKQSLSIDTTVILNCELKIRASI
ncbi:hypothetical protein AN641_03710 [Candidatus Epulonipiscioides gigas]|nr:hypothetical protein AN641_03710 [Epulopiscium sp. SCG-C07WGA-EpuloA2]